MGAYQAFLELGFQGRLQNVDELIRAELSVFRDLMEDYGLDVASVAKYSVTERIEVDDHQRELSRDVQLKILGTWTYIRVETRAPGVFVLHDRPR